MQPKTKTYTICTIAIIVTGIAICLICAWCRGPGLRHQILRHCGHGMDCACMSNIVKYRMTHNELRVFAKFMTGMQNRQNINILEFTDEQTAARILTAVSICRQKTESTTAKTKGK